MRRNIAKDKEKLLVAFRKTPIIEIACKQAGIPRSTYYRWRRDDVEFEIGSDEALEESAGRITDMAESQLISAIKEKNMTAITFWLKHHHRVYRTKIDVNANIQHVQQSLTPEQSEVVSNALRLAGLAEQKDQDEK